MITNENKFGISDNNMKQFQSDLIIYDPTYKNPNLAQLIVLNLYKYNYSEKISSNKSISSLSEILKIPIIYYEDIFDVNSEERLRKGNKETPKKLI